MAAGRAAPCIPLIGEKRHTWGSMPVNTLQYPSILYFWSLPSNTMSIHQKCLIEILRDHGASHPEKNHE
jgi:hypothetical protein